ncbi:MAG: DUF1538 family protein, partial [Mariprofundaceae bacterium]|nr:DUF1538 family protein [Mariprofundaceae bacterium]
MMSSIISFLHRTSRPLLGALRDLAPILIVIVVFQTLVLQQPIPNLGSMIVGFLCVLVGLALFVQG